MTRFVRLSRGITAAYRQIRLRRVAVPAPVVKTVQRENESLPADYRRNFMGGLIHGVFLQLSEAFSNINTVLPSFVATLTGSAVVIGLMVVAQEVGHVLPQMFTAYRVEDRPYEKPILMWIITMRWASWSLVAVVTAMFALDHPDGAARLSHRVEAAHRVHAGDRSRVGCRMDSVQSASVPVPDQLCVDLRTR
jgi:ABC-type xylose transport system permease subunit